MPPASWLTLLARPSDCKCADAFSQRMPPVQNKYTSASFSLLWLAVIHPGNCANVRSFGSTAPAKVPTAVS
jgi:hypothetical protein